MRSAAMLNLFKICQCCLYVFLLLLQLRAPVLNFLAGVFQLLQFALITSVLHIQYRFNFLQRPSQPFATQQQLEPGAVSPRIDSVAAVSGWTQQFLIFVEPDSSGGDSEFFAKF